MSKNDRNSTFDAIATESLNFGGGYDNESGDSSLTASPELRSPEKLSLGSERDEDDPNKTLNESKSKNNKKYKTKQKKWRGPAANKKTLSKSQNKQKESMGSLTHKPLKDNPTK